MNRSKTKTSTGSRSHHPEYGAYSDKEKLYYLKLGLRIGLTRDELGAHIGVHPNTITRWRRRLLPETLDVKKRKKQ